MKVLYDISILGLGYVDYRCRTGIFRVVENMAEQLVKRSDCETVFSCSTDEVMQKNTLDYLKSNINLLNSRLSTPFFFSEKLAIKNKIKYVEAQISSSVGEHRLKYLSKKLLIKALSIEEQALNALDRELISSRDIKTATIFHSTYYPIPEYVRKDKNKRLFMTSYDLIPVLAPQFTPSVLTSFFKAFLNTITPDIWILCISEDCRNDLLNYMGNRVDPAKVRVTELAASEKFYHCKDIGLNKAVLQKYDIPEGPYILSLCTLEPRKNIDSVIKAFAKLIAQENVPDLNLVLVGEGKNWMFDKVFDEMNLPKEVQTRIIITGFVNDEDLAPLYTEAIIFVYPSLYEGFGLPPLEAMQCGTPVITSNTTSLPEVVGDAGIMVAPTDLDALAHTMLKLYKNSNLRNEMVQKSLARARRFSWERCANETISAYNASL
jgi:glycosyltransferase involved in cell wall biosynthesis